MRGPVQVVLNVEQFITEQKIPSCGPKKDFYSGVMSCLLLIKEI